VPSLVPIRRLTLKHASAPGRRRHLSAASALTRVGERLYVIADDEHHLGVFRADKPRQRGELVRLRGGTLPDRKGPRKKRKPDFEALVALPAFAGYPSGALFALGSGSRPNRFSGVLLALDETGKVSQAPRGVDLEPWFARLAREFRELNIEGAFLDGDELALLQRGNKTETRNARVRVALQPTLAALALGEPLPVEALKDITDYHLGKIDGVPLCFTDGVALPGGGFAFCAVAENTDDAYADGACVGSAVGLMGANDCIRALWRVEGNVKAEGIEARMTPEGLELHLVTDADDAGIAAHLLATTLRGNTP
jgi:hypothetical protein